MPVSGAGVAAVLLWASASDTVSTAKPNVASPIKSRTASLSLTSSTAFGPLAHAARLGSRRSVGYERRRVFDLNQPDLAVCGSSFLFRSVRDRLCHVERLDCSSLCDSSFLPDA